MDPTGIPFPSCNNQSINQSACLLSHDEHIRTDRLTFTPPFHFPSNFSHSIFPSVTVRRTFALKFDSFDSFSESLFMSNTSGNVLAKTCFRGFCTSVINQVSSCARKVSYLERERLLLATMTPEVGITPDMDRSVGQVESRRY